MKGPRGEPELENVWGVPRKMGKYLLEAINVEDANALMIKNIPIQRKRLFNQNIT